MSASPTVFTAITTTYELSTRLSTFIRTVRTAITTAHGLSTRLFAFSSVTSSQLRPNSPEGGRVAMVPAKLAGAAPEPRNKVLFSGCSSCHRMLRAECLLEAAKSEPVSLTSQFRVPTHSIPHMPEPSPSGASRPRHNEEMRRNNGEVSKRKASEGPLNTFRSSRADK
jgi:hypothetical protein